MDHFHYRELRCLKLAVALLVHDPCECAVRPRTMRAIL
jgi:hypothetical protein